MTSRHFDPPPWLRQTKSNSVRVIGKNTSIASNSLQYCTVLTEDDGIPGSKLEREAEEYTVDQLKRWLKCRGSKLSGKRDELMECVRYIASRVGITISLTLALIMVNGLPQRFSKKVLICKKMVSWLRLRLFLRLAGVLFHLTTFLLSLTMDTCITTRWNLFCWISITPKT